MIIFCYRDIIEFNYDVLPQTTWGLEVVIHDMFTILLGPAMTGVARRQTSKRVVPGSCPCKVKRLAGRLAGSEKQCLPKTNENKKKPSGRAPRRPGMYYSSILG